MTLNVARKYELIAKLRILADDERTPAVEAESARRKMEAIEAKIRIDYENRVHVARNAAVAKPKLSSILKKKVVVSKSNSFPTDWPFGWTRREKIDVERIDFDSERKIVLGWKCPCCKMYVERVITPKHRARLQGNPNGVGNFIKSIQSGELNQLCDECFKQYQ